MKKLQLNDESLVEALPDAVVVLDADVNIIWWNTAAEQMFHIRESRAKCQPLVDLLKQSDVAALLTERCGTVEVSAPHRGGKQFAVSVIGCGDHRSLLVVRDITHTYNLEKMRQDFIANVSHELRTPLTVVLGYLEVMLTEYPEGSHEYVAVRDMHEQSVRMSKLVSDLLLIARMETHGPETVDKEQVNVGALLRSIHKEAQALSGQRQRDHTFSLEVDDTLELQGHEDLIRSAFSNLVFNAVHYTPPQGHIAIRWYKDEQEMAHLAVSDTGIGIKPEHIVRLTERFYRVDKGRSRAYGGTGLGLSIVKHVLLRHRGKLNIESTFGEGSTFHCLFPTQG